jgi:adenylate cyclase class 2
MKEIEILVKLDVADIGEAEVAVSAVAQARATLHTIDSYYCDPLRNHLAPGSEGQLVASCRIREFVGTGRGAVAYKDDNFDESGRWTHSDEFETAVDSPKMMAEIFGHLGLEMLVVVNCIKRTYENERFTVVVEQVKGLGLYLEVESRATEAEVLEERQAIQVFIDSLGLAYTRASDGGKPEQVLAMERRTGPGDRP